MNHVVVRTDGGEPTGEFPRDARAHYALGAVGLGVTMLSVFFTYSALVGLANLFPLLSTTVIVFVGIVTWVVAWIALDVAHEWYAHRRYVH